MSHSRGVLPKDYARPALNKIMLGELIDLFSNINLNGNGASSKDVLGRVYEYFLGQFAGAEGKRGGGVLQPPFRCACAGGDAQTLFRAGL